MGRRSCGTCLRTWPGTPCDCCNRVHEGPLAPRWASARGFIKIKSVVEHDPRLFFQVAAGLIPALIFGGLISERLKPSATPRRWRWVVGFAVATLPFLVLFAEVVAINVALVGSPSAFETWVVALVLVGLTAGAL